jgi:hypothetical protein
VEPLLAVAYSILGLLKGKGKGIRKFRQVTSRRTCRITSVARALLQKGNNRLIGPLPVIPVTDRVTPRKLGKLKVTAVVLAMKMNFIHLFVEALPLLFQFG